LILSRTANATRAKGEGEHRGWDIGRHLGWNHAPHWGALDGMLGNVPDKHNRAENGRSPNPSGKSDPDDARGGQHTASTTYYTYDNALRLTGAQGALTESYAYDAASNITQLNAGGTSTAISVNNVNAIQSAGSRSFVYDANGNLLDDGVNTYAWDAADRLIRIQNKQSGHVSQFRYDGHSRRVGDTETDPGQSPVATSFLWCGDRLCERRDGNDTILARYYPEGELLQNAPYYYAKDQVGSVVALVDAAGSVAGRLSYGSYGNVTSSTGILPDFRYAQLFDHPPSGLYLANHRAYDSQVGRWISRDPIREAGGINLYAYVRNNPLRYTDPMGLFDPGPILEPITKVAPRILPGILGPIGSVIGGLWPSEMGSHPCESGPPGACAPTPPPTCHTKADCEEAFRIQWSICSKLQGEARRKCQQNATNLLAQCLQTATE
jgi:RHS repeat-associated protein